MGAAGGPRAAGGLATLALEALVALTRVCVRGAQLKNAKLGPSQRTGHTVNVLGLPNNPTAVVFGGCTADGVVNEIFTLKLGQETLEWTKTPKVGGLEYAPSPRWRHTATTMPGQKSIFVFGGMDQQKRFDDCFLLTDKGTGQWRWSDPKCSGSIPSARANHTATIAGPKGEEKLYVIGGYGGPGFSRVMFNDVHVMDCNTFEWTKVSCTGTLPDPRANHVTVAVRDKLFMMGGRSFTDVYDDMFTFDIAESKWTLDSSVKMPEPTYNHSGVACMAVPTWKAFFFGGRQGSYSQDEDTRKYSDSILVLDADKLAWLQPTVLGTAPPAREDAHLVYDSKNSRMVLIGGWADQMFQDVHTLDVSMIVGPPYAVSSCLARV